jgi:hypothetical protein
VPLISVRSYLQVGLDRDVVDKVYNKFTEVMGRCIMEGRKVVITINKVAGESLQLRADGGLCINKLRACWPSQRSVYLEVNSSARSCQNSSIS